MSAEVRACKASELGQVVDLLTRQFVHGAARSIALPRRYPDLFHPRRSHRIVTAWIGSRLVGVVATRPFDWATPDGLLNGTMIGFVTTAVGSRNQGIASEMLVDVREHAKASSADFAVLWTRQRAFYERLGWANHDSSTVGVHTRGRRSRLNRPPYEELQPQIAAGIESLRRDLEPTRVLRPPVAYERIPLGVNRMLVDLIRGDSMPSAYALFGAARSSACLYEVVGGERDRMHLARTVTQAHARTEWHSHAGEALADQWTNGEWAWHPEHHTMWLALSSGVSASDFHHWHIPAFDRI